MASFQDLPLEIVTFIAENLQDLYIDSKPFAHIAETVSVGSPEWRCMASRSQQDVCNFRLVSRKTASSASKTFGNVIGNRTFRVTPANVQDLLDIWTMSDLSSYINTLTFGDMCFTKHTINGREAGNDMLEEVLKEVEDRTQAARLEESYARCSRESYALDITHELLAAIEVFPNLRCLRLNHMDSMQQKGHLQGWLLPGDSEILEAAFEVFKRVFPGTNNQCWNEPLSAYLYSHSNRSTDNIFNAFIERSTQITDLRVGRLADMLRWDFFSRNWPENPQTLAALGNLRRFDFTIGMTSFAVEGQMQILEGMFKVTPLLTDISINWPRYQIENVIAVKLDSTKKMCQRIACLDKLQRICLRGEWYYTQDMILALLRSQSRTLEYLILGSPILLIPKSVVESAGWKSFLPIMFPCLAPVMKLVYILDPYSATYDATKENDLSSYHLYYSNNDRFERLDNPQSRVLHRADFEKEAKTLPIDCMIHVESKDFSLTLASGGR